MTYGITYIFVFYYALAVLYAAGRAPFFNAMGSCRTSHTTHQVTVQCNGHDPCWCRHAETHCIYRTAVHTRHMLINTEYQYACTGGS